jgi:hypothetical protein
MPRRRRLYHSHVLSIRAGHQLQDWASDKVAANWELDGHRQAERWWFV